MAKKTTISREGLEFLIGAVKNTINIGDIINNEDLADNKTYSNIKIEERIDDKIDEKLANFAGGGGGASEAEFVSYDNESLPSVTNVEECLDAIIAKIYYVNPSITSFTCNPSRTAYEMGEKVTSVTFTWTYNKDMVSQTLTGCDLADETVRTATYSTEFNSNKTFTLSASDGTESATRSITISFRDKVYFGGASQPDTYDSAFVLGLGTANFATAKKGTYSMNVGAGQYGYLAIPTAFGAIDSVWIGGFEVTVDNCGAINFTNASGYTSSYTIYKTGQQGLGSITMEVK